MNLLQPQNSKNYYCHAFRLMYLSDNMSNIMLELFLS